MDLPYTLCIFLIDWLNLSVIHTQKYAMLQETTFMLSKEDYINLVYVSV